MLPDTSDSTPYTNALQRWYKNLDKGWIVAAVLPFIGILPAFNITSVINTADGLFHVHRILAMSQLMASGDLYPRWIPWFHLGYGYPIFNFYAPAASYIGGLLGLVGISATLAYNLIAAVCWIGGGLGIYALARRFLPGSAAIVAVALWAYAPSRLQDVWNIGNLSGFIGTALLPWFFFALTRLIDKPTYRRLALLALTFAGVILAHQPTTVLAGLIVLPGVPLMCFWTARRQDGHFIRRLLLALGGLALGVGIATIFLLPMLAELPFIKVSLEAGDIPSVLQSGFLSPDQLFLKPTAPDLTDISRSLPDTLGLASGILGALGFLALLRARKIGLALAWGAGVLFCIYLLLDSSFDFWLTVPLLDQLRFPARVLRLAVVFLSLLGGASLLLLPARWRDTAAVVVCIIVIAAALPTIYPSRDVVYYTGITPLDEIEYELETYAFGGTSYNEFKPIWATRTPTDSPPSIEKYATDPMQIWFVDARLPDVTIESVGDMSVRVMTPQNFELSFRHFYFPGWMATLDGVPVAVYPASDFGLITLNVPPGEHIVSIHRDNTPVEHVAVLLTLVSFAVTVLLLRSKSTELTSVHELSSESLPPRLAGLLTGAMITFAALNMVYILPQTMWFRVQSPPDTPAAMQTPVNQIFGDAYELLGYTLHSRTAVPGRTFGITLFWRALRPLDHTYRPSVQLNNPGLTEAWAANQGFFVGSSPIVHTPDYFTSDVHRVAVFDDAPPYVGYITVKLTDPQTDQPLLLPDGTDTLRLNQPVRVLGANLAVKHDLDYTLGDDLELWCASLQPDGDQLHIDLYWHVNATPDNHDLRVFVHGLDVAGNLVEQADSPPMNGDYAVQDWLPGQNLRDQYTLTNNQAIQQVAIGLYIPAGNRLRVMQGQNSVPEDRILLGLMATDCLT